MEIAGKMNGADGTKNGPPNGEQQQCRYTAVADLDGGRFVGKISSSEERQNLNLIYRRAHEPSRDRFRTIRKPISLPYLVNLKAK